ncbi:DUF2564 family protein [Bacillus mangrovi]|uniref:DUF2564 family protein n=1 Tax=Metabacillus mangrovi TaxID=1491830 RepID=A0A7X2S1M0_9BACI|nr:DUF2564 family protein [Metabacillus mangrovi]MTH52097.1 DUF2564 family protein [Metabacillus mangrovi]
MDQTNHNGSGLNDLAQLELAVEASKNITGSSTMSMDPEALNDAEKCIKDARAQLDQVKITGVDQQFLENQKALLDQCQHQIDEARKG